MQLFSFAEAYANQGTFFAYGIHAELHFEQTHSVQACIVHC